MGGSTAYYNTWRGAGDIPLTIDFYLWVSSMADAQKALQSTDSLDLGVSHLLIELVDLVV